MLKSLNRSNIYRLSMAATGFIFCTSNIASLMFCNGESMRPTVNTIGELALLDIFSHKWLHQKIQRGDVVIAQLEPGKRICKRVRGVEGDIVYNRVSPNKVEEIILQKGELWLQGDNPTNSRDSRTVGPFSVSQVVGKIMTKFNPSYWKKSDLPREYDFENLQLRDYNTKVFRNGARWNEEKKEYEPKFSSL